MLYSSQVKFTSERFILQPISEKVILKPLRDLKVKNATGLDGIPARFLKDSAAIYNTYANEQCTRVNANADGEGKQWKRKKKNVETNLPSVYT